MDVGLVSGDEFADERDPRAIATRQVSALEGSTSNATKGSRFAVPARDGGFSGRLVSRSPAPSPRPGCSVEHALAAARWGRKRGARLCGQRMAVALISRIV